MSLAELAQAMENYDPKKDKINGGGNGLPAGDYNVIIEEAAHKTFRSGWDCLGFTFKVIDGDHAGQKESVNLSFAETAKSGKAIPDFVLERNMKTVITLGHLMNVDVPVKAFLLPNETDIHEELGQLLRSEIGATAKMTISERENKKNPAEPFKEYEFEASNVAMETPAADATPFNNAEDLDLENMELPFD